ncbi:MAG: GNAT family N-acetyltransferase [Pseudomonadota bacterium]
MIVTTALSTARLTLRMPHASDLPAYTAYCASDRARFVRGPFTAPQAFEKFAAMAGHWTLRGFGRYVIERNGAPIGHVGPMQLDDSQEPELTWTLWNGAHEGQGLATEAALRVRDHLIRDLGWPQMVILIMPDNTGSVRLAERIGATLTDIPAPDWYAGCRTYRLTAEAVS